MIVFVMKKYAIIIITAMLMSCQHQEQSPVSTPSFTNEVMLRTTPVKNQGESALCWIYAMLATIETEHLMQGDSVNLSADFVVRHLLEEQSRRYYLSQCQQPISLDGMAPQLIRCIRRFGLVAFDSYHADEQCNYEVIRRKLTQMGKHSVALRKGLSHYMHDVSNMLDETVRPLPRYQFMLGAEYTALEFAHSVCGAKEYVALTSIEDHPYGQPVMLDMGTGSTDDTFINTPVEKLQQFVVHALRSGHPVCWEGDISEPGFSFEKGIALYDHEPPSKQLRQQQLDRFQTTDDHCMAIVGLARDATGKHYFICKNSWGDGNPYKGFIYMSFDYFYMKTIAIVMPQKAIPQSYYQ